MKNTMFMQDVIKLSSERKYTDEGYLRVPANIARSGIQFYTAAEMEVSDRAPGALIAVWRSPEEVFDPESMQSFANKPLTDSHPPVSVDVGNYKDFAVGTSGDTVAQKEGFVHTTLNLTDALAIRNIESGKNQLSNGYTAEIVWGDGVTPEGEEYNAIQKHIRGNHIAIVACGRAGAECRVADHKIKTEEDIMAKKITIDSVDYEVEDQVAQAVAKLQTDMAARDTTISELRTAAAAGVSKLDTVQAKLDGTQVKLDAAIAAQPTQKQLDVMVATRATLVSRATSLVADYDATGKNDATIKAEVIKHLCPTVDIAKESADYIDARFDMLLEGGTPGAVTTTNPLDQELVDQHKHKDAPADTRPADVIAREKFNVDSRNAWKSPALA